MFRPFPSIKVVLAATTLFQVALNVSSSCANVSEGTAPTGPGEPGAVVGIGALTLQPNATIALAGANGGSELVVPTSNFISGTVANIVQWTGTAAADGSDRLLFGTNPKLITDDVRFRQFADDAGANFATDASTLLYDESYEFVSAPVPEPATWAAAAMTLLAVAVSQRRRLSVLRRSWR